ncbi:MAG: BA14K family protein, partial [Mesorhizobium sp.]
GEAAPESRVEQRGDGNRETRRREDDRRGPPQRVERRGDGNREFRRGDDRRGPPRFERRRDGNTYFNGHRGYREKRRGYRYYEGFWFPPAAFALGMMLHELNRAGPDWEDHVDWCYDRYGSRYRERDNTYIARDGYRRVCNSPYS